VLIPSKSEYKLGTNDTLVILVTQELRPYFENTQYKKGLEEWLKW
jgi:hypothetical protein